MPADITGRAGDQDLPGGWDGGQVLPGACRRLKSRSRVLLHPRPYLADDEAMSPLPTPEDLELSPLWSVVRAAHALERRATALLAAHEVTPVQFGVPSYLAATGPMTTGEIARSVLGRPQSITDVVNTMESADLCSAAAHEDGDDPTQHSSRLAARSF